VVLAQAPQQLQPRHAGQGHVADQTAAADSQRRGEKTLGTVVILNIRVQLTQQGTKHSAIRGVGFDHSNDGAGVRHKKARMNCEGIVVGASAATATGQDKPEPQGGLGAVDSPVSRGRMLLSWPSPEREKVALVLKEDSAAERCSRAVFSGV